MARTLRSAAGIALVLCAGLTMAGCKNDRRGSAAAERTAGAPSGSAGAPAPTASVARCPLTAERVSAALGAQVKPPDASCSFFPADENKVLPNAGYNMQFPIACDDSMLDELEYRDHVEGLGVTAHAAERGDGFWLLVCRAGAPFEIRVDTGDEQTARAAATALARQVLAAR